MEFQLDFTYDDKVVDLYYQALSNTYTNEGRISNTTYTREQAERRLFETSKTKSKNNFDLLGILKVYKDNRLVALCFPRQVIPSEYDKFLLNPINDYYRLSGIFVHEDYRGQGIALQVLEWFIEKYKFVLWTADETNSASIKVAEKANLTYRSKVDVKNSEGEIVYTSVAYSN